MRPIPAISNNVAIKYKEEPLRRKNRRYDQVYSDRYYDRELKVIEGRRYRDQSLAHRVSIRKNISFPMFMMFVSFICAGLIINVAQKALVSQSSYQIETLKKQIQIEKQIQDKLLAQKAKLESPERIEALALKKLNMVKAPKVSYLRLSNLE